ncbi:hypothetical protein [Gordonia neofelifaecis]|uniref:Mce-associated membrane protein n=1 Tax=Gordonia neofelifaecis NRRL B-59395 TaxID=644548 RepID=F1YIW4_9ACTN|nr:hypothetical protein [Gordonia neofelifaecis]EGD55411.1 hypothetical protein SCNU_09136 [Gordonia neofelifaecis NRRL B-59395]
MSRVQRWLLPVLALVVVFVVGATIALGVIYANAAAEERARDSAQSAAQTYVVDMFSWNPKNVDQHINTTMGRLTGGAQKDYQSHIVEQKVAEGVKQQGVSTAVTVQGAGVMENTRTTAKVLLFINQSSTRNDVSEVQVDKSRLIFGMEKQGDDWKINQIDILDDDNLAQHMQSGDGTPPSNAVPIPGAPAPSQAPESTPAG